MLEALVIAALGWVAGFVTTAAGFGGGMLLALGLGVMLGPVPALAISAPALLVGHVHRSWALRTSIDPRTAKVFAGVAVPGAILGGLALVHLPPSIIWWILLAGVLLAGFEAAGLMSVRLGRRLLWPGSFSIGFLASSGGIGGVLLPPVLMSAGLSGATFVATASVGALATQIARVATYGATGLVDTGTLTMSVVVAIGVLAGNAAGRRVLDRMEPSHQKTLARVVLVVALGLAAYGATFG